MALRVTVRYTYLPAKMKGVRFGKQELSNIAMALGALTLAFAILYLDPLGGNLASFSAIEIAIILLFSFIAVLTGFLMHELAHKFVALRYGIWAEFRASVQGLLIAIVTALIGFIFAAPGAVMVYGHVNTRQNGIISIAGPLTNLAFGGGFLAMLIVFVFVLPGSVHFLFLILFSQIVIVNLILGIFNMIPIPPLDGSKVLRWKMPLWIGLFAVFILLLAVYFIYL